MSEVVPLSPLRLPIPPYPLNFVLKVTNYFNIIKKKHELFFFFTFSKLKTNNNYRLLKLI
jgi:hypothetical protein